MFEASDLGTVYSVRRRKQGSTCSALLQASGPVEFTNAVPMQLNVLLLRCMDSRKGRTATSWGIRPVNWLLLRRTLVR